MARAENIRAVVQGVRYDARSSFLRGCADAPQAVRRVLGNGSANWCTESGVDLSQRNDWRDEGDVEPPDDALAALEIIDHETAARVGEGVAVLSIGGDHAITHPIMQAMARVHREMTIVHFDAHPDLYDELDGDRLSHACPFARIMEEHLASRLIQVGVRTSTPHQREQAVRFGVDTYETRSWDGMLPALSGNVYLSIDVDVLDPAFAPGVSHHEPGGLDVRQLLGALTQVAESDCTIVGADIVEINPGRDINDMTAMVGAKLVREVLGMMLS
ncbi:MAG: agmatinase [Actinomycetia bacterium]|nr:agmatinase [Actinomycetes bacterium]